MNKKILYHADFRLFTVLWNQQQNMNTPALHFTMIDWLENAWNSGDRRLLMQAFRGSGKSTMIGLFTAWLLYRNPDLRILVLSAEENLAKKMVRQVRRIIERHWLTRHLKPKNADQWSGDQFTVKRGIELRDPSMLARGITGNITGSRADVIICDDVEVPNTSDSAEKREELRNRLDEISFILVPDGTQIYVGTQHTYHTIYAEDAREELDEEVPFLDGFARLTLPVMDKSGAPIWPGRFSSHALKQLKRDNGPNKFASQMMLQPVNIADGRLDASLLQIYDNELDYTKELQSLFIGPTKLVSSSAWWDPSFASARGDYSVVAVTYSDAEGNIYIHHLEYIQIDATSEQDEASQQCEIVSALARDHYLPSITVESNGIGKLIPGILKNRLAQNHVPCRVQEHHSSRGKDLRILEAFDAPLAARRLFVHRSVLQTPFMTEMQEWRPGKSKMHDDGLDAVAGAIAQAPMRLKRIYGKGGYSWMRGNASAHKANTNFDV